MTRRSKSPLAKFAENFTEAIERSEHPVSFLVDLDAAGLGRTWRNLAVNTLHFIMPSTDYDVPPARRLDAAAHMMTPSKHRDDDNSRHITKGVMKDPHLVAGWYDCAVAYHHNGLAVAVRGLLQEARGHDRRHLVAQLTEGERPTKAYNGIAAAKGAGTTHNLIHIESMLNRERLEAAAPQLIIQALENGAHLAAAELAFHFADRIAKKEPAVWREVVKVTEGLASTPSVQSGLEALAMGQSVNDSRVVMVKSVRAANHGIEMAQKFSRPESTGRQSSARL